MKSKSRKHPRRAAARKSAHGSAAVVRDLIDVEVVDSLNRAYRIVQSARTGLALWGEDTGVAPMVVAALNTAIADLADVRSALGVEKAVRA